MSVQTPRVITRNRERLACRECRRRKLRCDRSIPCSSCVRRGDEAACSYQRFAEATDRRQEQHAKTETRLGHLEQLVQQLASGTNDISTGTSNSTNATPGAADRMGEPGLQTNTGVTNGLNHNGSKHWSAMLDDIPQLRLALPVDEPYLDDQEDDDVEYTGIDLIFGGGSPSSFEAILAKYLPARLDVDRMVSSYFRAQAVAAPFIHAGRFRAQYQEFWKNPCLASPLWTSILFSICHIAANTLRQTEPVGEEINIFSVAAAHCLVIGQYFRPKPTSVEALLLFSHAQCLTHPELPPDIAPLLGVLVRCATRMGYHRDPESLRISVFEQEMRRRAWSVCMQLDLLISFHLGLPSNVQFPTWDTKAPQAVADSEFDEHCTELPPAKADFTTSGMVFYIAKHQFMVIFEKILRHTMDTNPDPSEVKVLDAEIRRQFESLPEPWRRRSMSESVVDPAHLIVTRLCCSFVYYKCLCVLHRPYVTRGRVESIMICYGEASNLLRDFVDAFYEFTSGGQAETEKWFLGSLTWHDFLFGIMVLCLIICATTSENPCPGIEVHETLNLLRRARSLCAEQESRRHKDTKRIGVLVDAIVVRFGEGQQRRSPSIISSGFSNWQMESTSDDLHSAQAQVFWGGPSGSFDTMTGLGQDPTWDYFDEFLNL